MAQILVRNLTLKTVARLKRRAKANGRTLQAELRLILEEHARQLTSAEALRACDRIRERFAGRKFPDSAELIREDRDR
jgi:plasmid stability protein